MYRAPFDKGVHVHTLHQPAPWMGFHNSKNMIRQGAFDKEPNLDAAAAAAAAVFAAGSGC
jgi:hypothetical protein